MDEKQRRISRVLTIDEIINPPGQQRLVPGPAAAAPGSTAIRITEVENVNPHFLRINHGHTMYMSESGGGVGGGASPMTGGVVRGKSVSFASRASTATTPSVEVYREQYWNWSCACKNWTKRERRLLLGVGILGCIIIGLVAFISVYSREHRFPPSLSDPWLGWTF